MICTAVRETTGTWRAKPAHTLFRTRLRTDVDDTLSAGLVYTAAAVLSSVGAGGFTMIV